MVKFKIKNIFTLIYNILLHLLILSIKYVDYSSKMVIENFNSVNNNPNKYNNSYQI